MPVYSFTCPACGRTGDVLRDTHDSTPPPCPDCAPHIVTMRRVYTSFGFKRSMPEHFNATTGTFVSNTRAFRDDLKRKSEEMTLRLGIEHNYQPVDPADAKEVYGVTDEGLEDTMRRRRAMGQSEGKLWL